MVRIYRRSDAKSNPDGKDIWERVKPSELGLNPAGLSGSARASAHAVSGRVYGGAPRAAGRTAERPIQGKKNFESPTRRCVQSVVSALDAIDLPDTANVLRDVFLENGKDNYSTPPIRKINEWDYNAAYVSPAPRPRSPTRLSGIRGKKNPVMVLVNIGRNQGDPWIAGRHTSEDIATRTQSILRTQSENLANLARRERDTADELEASASVISRQIEWVRRLKG